MAKSISLDEYGDVLQPADVQAILHVSRHTVKNLMDEGKLNYFRVGSYYRIPKDSLIKLITQTNIPSSN